MPKIKRPLGKTGRWSLRRKRATGSLRGIFSHNTPCQLPADEPIQTQVISHRITGCLYPEPFSLLESWGTPWTQAFALSTAPKRQTSSPWEQQNSQQPWEGKQRPNTVPEGCQPGFTLLLPDRYQNPSEALEPHTRAALLGLLANLGLRGWIWPRLHLHAAGTHEAAPEQPHVWARLFSLAQTSHVLASCSR